MGGVGGALAQHAEHTLANLAVDEKRHVREAFRQLVTADGTRAVLTRRELVHVLGAESEPVIEKLVAARLLVTTEAEGGEQQVEIVHEALLGAWPRLVQWRRDDAEGARLRDQLRAAARQWDERNRPAGLLWRGEALAELELWRARVPAPLPDVAEAFASASRRTAASGRFRRLVLAGVAFGLLLAAVVTISALYRRTQHDAAVLAERLARAEEEHGRQLVLGGNAAEALHYLLEAQAQGIDDVGLRFLIARARQATRPDEVVLKHGGPVWSAVFTADGARVLTASADRTARLWDAQTGAPVLTLAGHGDQVYAASESPDGKLVATASFDGTARLWDAHTGAPLHTLAHGARVNVARFDSGSQRVLTASNDKTVALWDAASGERLRSLPMDGEVRRATFSPDGANVGAEDTSGLVRVWDAATGAVVLEQHGEPEAFPLIVSFSPDGARIAYTTGKAARVVEVGTGTLVREVVHGSRVEDACFLDEGRTLATAGHDRLVKVWDVASGTLSRSLQGHSGFVFGLTPGGGRLASRSTQDIKIWDPSTGELLGSYENHTAAVRSLVLDANGERGLSASNDDTARVWRTLAGPLLRTIHAHDGGIAVYGFSTDGRVEVTAGNDGTVKIWDVPSYRMRAQFRVEGRIRRVLTSTTGQQIVVINSDDEQVRVFRDGKLASTLDCHIAPGEEADLSADGSTIMIGSKDGTIRLWTLNDGREVRSLHGHEGPVQTVFFAAGGTKILSTSVDGTVRVWDASSGEPTNTIKTGVVVTAALSRDGQKIITGSYEGVATVWDLATSRKFDLKGHTDSILWVAFGQNDELIATSSSDGTVRLWDAQTGQPLAIYQHPTHVFVAFSSNAPILVTTEPDGILRLWDVSLEPARH
jgi:WD40 repeat protein